MCHRLEEGEGGLVRQEVSVIPLLGDALNGVALCHRLEEGEGGLVLREASVIPPLDCAEPCPLVVPFWPVSMEMQGARKC